MNIIRHKAVLVSVATCAMVLVACSSKLRWTAPLSPRVASALESASAARGGALYDKWWAVAGTAAPATDHSLWAQRPDKQSNKRSGSATWRCKECHGWDYKGVEGAYKSGSHRTGMPGIYESKLSPQQLFDSISRTHGYAEAGLTDADTWHLVKFVTEGQIDSDRIIDSRGHFDGNAARGKALFSAGLGDNPSCAHCHGDDGLQTPKGSEGTGFDEFPGHVAKANPWEFVHKVRFGQPGKKMPRASTSDCTIQDLGDLGAFAQSLPNEPRNP